MKPTTKKNNLDLFMDVYRDELRKSVMFHPAEFGYGIEAIPQVADRLESALRENRFFMKDSRAVTETCNRLKIDHTYIGIKDYVNGQSPKESTISRVLSRVFKSQNARNN